MSADSTIAFRIDSTVKETLLWLAARSDLSPSELLRQIVEEYLARRKGKTDAQKPAQTRRTKTQDTQMTPPNDEVSRAIDELFLVEEND